MKLHPLLEEDAALATRAVGAPMESLAGRTVLISGGGGFLGAALVDAIQFAARSSPKPIRLVVVDNFATGVPDRLAYLRGSPHIEWVRADVSKPLPSLPRSQYVIHAASIASPPVYRARPLATIDVNVWGTRNLLEFARAQPEMSGFLLMSTSEVYGNPPPSAIPTGEAYVGNVSFTGPRACYDESKRLGETMALVFQKAFSLPVKIVRPFNAYGPGQRLDDGRIVPDLLRAAARGQPLVLHGDGRATRSFCYVRDATIGFLKALLRGPPGEAFNIGNPEEVTIADLAAVVSNLSGTPIVHRENPDPHYLTDNPQRRCPDLRKAESMLGYAATVSVREGIRRSLDWAKGAAA